MVYQPTTKILRALVAERLEIVRSIDDTLAYTSARADTECLKKAGEVDYVAFFFLYGLRVIEARMRDALRKHDVTVAVAGVFCHQSPKVRFTHAGAQESCELGDITFLATYGKKLRGGGLGNAV